MTREEAVLILKYQHKYGQMESYVHEALGMAIEALSAEPCREVDDYENEIAYLHNRLDIAEYDKERLREEVMVLEEKLTYTKYINSNNRKGKTWKI